jgi:hypothetical protein
MHSPQVIDPLILARLTAGCAAGLLVVLLVVLLSFQVMPQVVIQLCRRFAAECVVQVMPQSCDTRMPQFVPQVALPKL